MCTLNKRIGQNQQIVGEIGSIKMSEGRHKGKVYLFKYSKFQILTILKGEGMYPTPGTVFVLLQGAKEEVNLNFISINENIRICLDWK